MKKILLFILMMIVPTMVLAKEYTFDDIGLKMNISDDWYVFTRENYKNNDFLIENGISEEYMQNFFTQNKAYVNALPKDYSFDMIVNITAANLEMNNLSNYKDEMIMDTAKDATKSLKDAKYSVYNNGNHKFMLISFFDTSTNKYIYRYYTVFNHNGFSFAIQTNEEPTESQKQALDEIAKTIYFDKIKFDTKESAKLQKEIDNYGKSKKWYSNILIDAIIGGVVGFLTSVVIKMKKKKDNQNVGA